MVGINLSARNFGELGRTNIPSTAELNPGRLDSLSQHGEDSRTFVTRYMQRTDD